MNSRFFDFSELVDPRHTRMDLLRVNVRGLWQLRETFPLLIDDLLDVAMAIYVADRLLKRRRIDGAWQPRHFRLRIPVSDPAHWQAAASALIELLRWLTTDTWELEFVTQATEQRIRPASAFPPTLPRKPFVALYSGGLDSLAGAVAQALDPAFDGAVLVGAQSAARVQGLQRDQYEALTQHLPGVHWEKLRGFPHRMKAKQLRDWFIPEQRQEKSQRSRAFLFMVFGAVTAYAYQTDTLYVYENGIGAINLPYTPSFRGADMTRAMHPRTLLKTGQFLTQLLGSPLSITNASLWKTKGEMCAVLEAAGLGALALLTKSCDSFPLREAHDQCGLCTSCLLRRLSLHAAGLSGMEHDQPTYRDDIYTMSLQAANEALRPYFFMFQQTQDMIDKLKSRDGNLLEFRLAFDAIEEARYAIEEATGWPLAEVDRRLADLYLRYAAEMTAFHQDLTGRDSPQGSQHDELVKL